MSTPSDLLNDVRILDFTRILAGPYCTMVLADMGAEVLKIERPGIGDDTRAMPPFAGGESGYFLAINRNKKSLAVDLTTEPGKQVIRDLVTQSDVVIENFRPGTMEKLGLGYQALRALNPRLIYCAISGFGRTGPDKDRAGVDLIVEAVGGLMSITGEPDRPPVKVGVAIIDIATGLHAHGAILGALYARERSGEGRRIDLSLIEVQVATLVNMGSDHLIGGIVPRRWGSAHASVVPYQAFQTSDGYLVAGTTNESLWQRFCQALELPELTNDPRFSTNVARVANRIELLELLDSVFIKRSRADWLERFRKAGIPCGPINTLDEVFQDPQVQHLDIVQAMDHPTAGRVRIIGSPLQFDDDRPPVRTPAPRLGEHTAEILSTLLGYSPDRIDELRRSAAINGESD